MKKLNNLIVDSDNSIQDVIRGIELSKNYACILLFQKKTFLNLITDGDVRRAILSGFKLTDSAINIHNLKVKSSRPKTIAIDYKASKKSVNALFAKYSLRQLLLFKDSKPYSILLNTDLNEGKVLKGAKNQFLAIVMAGGFGKRLYPLTKNIPKPLLDFQGKPIIEHIVRNLIASGASRIIISTHYLSEKIINHFKAIDDINIEIDFIVEKSPMGTAGVLSKIKKLDNINLLINGDVLTNLNFDSLIFCHKKTKAFLTMVSNQHILQIPYGVVNCNSEFEYTSMIEKPEYSFFVNSGIYLFNKNIIKYLPQAKSFSMPEVIDNLNKKRKKINIFPIYEKWVDIGSFQDLNNLRNTK